MSRSLRSEYAAHQALIQNVNRDDWRAILAKRDAKRAEYRYRQSRRPQSARFAPIVCALFAVAAALPVVSFFA